MDEEQERTVELPEDTEFEDEEEESDVDNAMSRNHEQAPQGYPDDKDGLIKKLEESNK